jgi:hypothetical protein
MQPKTCRAPVQLKLNIPKDPQGNATTVFKVPQHSTVNLEVLREKSGELHIHAYRLSPTVKEGEKKTLSFLAKASGKFNIEWHPKGPGCLEGWEHPMQQPNMKAVTPTPLHWRALKSYPF